jgi:hypothetical protein
MVFAQGPAVLPVAVAPMALMPLSNEPVNVVPAPDLDVVIEQAPWQPISASQRLAWFSKKSFGISNTLGSIPAAAWNTGLDHPHEAGPHWAGFGERYGVSVSTTALSAGLEAGIGAAWGEDPRYFRAGPTMSAKSRIGRVLKWTVMAPNRDGELRPAYARYMAYTGSSFISDAWREPSDQSLGNEAGRIGISFLGRMGANAFDEFWPDTKRKLFHHATKDDN